MQNIEVIVLRECAQLGEEWLDCLRMLLKLGIDDFAVNWISETVSNYTTHV